MLSFVHQREKINITHTHIHLRTSSKRNKGGINQNKNGCLSREKGKRMEDIEIKGNFCDSILLRSFNFGKCCI